MPLTIIKGPPNSGRTEQIRRRYLELLQAGRNPVLVVPGVDDIFGWERRLTEGSGAVIGGQILHFRDLYGEILALGKEERPESATEIRRLHLVRQAITSRWGSVAERIDDQPGLVKSVLDLIDDFRAEGRDPETLADTVERDDLHHLKRLVDVYREYLRLLTGEPDADRMRSRKARLTDSPNEARLAVERVTGLWRSRPVMFVGFDELTPQQLELVRRLAVEVEVMIAVTHEPGNPALELTGKLVSDLEDFRPEIEVQTIDTKRGGARRPHAPLLLELEERFLRARPIPDPEGPLQPSDALTVLRSTGNRNEAEAIALEIARLVADDVPPGRIGISVGNPAQNGPVLRDTLERFGIPVSLEAETVAGATVVGQALLNLLRAAGPSDSAGALLAFLRTPGGLDRDVVDRLERALRVDGIDSAGQAADFLKARLKVSPPAAWNELARTIADRQPIAEVVGEIAGGIGMAMLDADPAPVPGASTTIETRMASAITGACLAIGEIHDAKRQPAAIIEALGSGVIRVWAAPANGTVKIASPYSLRAKRLEYLFCASLQESGLTDTERAGPFLSVGERSKLGLSPRRPPEDQERYLFYSNLTVPTKRLWLSCRTSDETGKAEHPSPLITAIEDLFPRDGQDRSTVNSGGRTGSEITFRPADAPSEDELARGLAALGPDRDAALSGLELETGVDESIRTRLAGATAAEERSRNLASLGDLLVDTVRNGSGLTAYPKFSASEIEAYAGCPYRWFIERQLAPQPFEPDPDYLAVGSLLHNVLEQLYDNHTGEIPRNGTLSDWCAEVPPLIEEHARSWRIGLGGDSASHRVLRRRVEQMIITHLEREAGWDPLPGHLPNLFEARFGLRRGETGSLRIEGWALKGKIDRIDLSPAAESPSGGRREAVVVDYKSGRVEDLGYEKAEQQRKFQVQLYLQAVREKFGFTPVAGIYVPLRTDEGEARGAYSGRVDGEMELRRVSRKDEVEDLDDFIKQGIEQAKERVAGMLAGILAHDPATCPDHLNHPAVQDRARWTTGVAAEEAPR